MARVLNEEPNRSGCRVHGATVALLWMSRACGAAPVTFERQRSLYIVRTSRKYALIARIIAFLLAVIMAFVLYFDAKTKILTNSLPGNYVAHLMIKYVNYLLTSLVLTVAVYGGANRMHRFLSYYTQIQKIQASIEHKPKSRRVEKVLRTLLAVGMTIVIMACITNAALGTHGHVHPQESWILHAFYRSTYIAHVVSSLLLFQITFVVVLVLWSLKCLNNNIKRLSHRIQEVNEDGRPAVVDTVRGYTSTYAFIFDVCYEINSTEGFTMLLLLFECAFRMLSFAYYIIVATYIDSTEGMYAQIVEQLLNVMRICFHLIMLVEPCHRMHGELKKTRVLISEVLCAPLSALHVVSLELVRFYESTEPYEDVYTPLGTFKFSRSLYTAIIGGLTTIMVIVIHISNT